MATTVLVAYATKHSATAGIAEKIGEELREAGLACDVKPAATVDDLTSYQAVVLGSAVYMGAWRKEAAKLLKTQEAQLAQRPVWLFSSGPMGEGDVQELMKGWRFPQKLQPVADRIHPPRHCRLPWCSGSRGHGILRALDYQERQVPRR